MTKHEKLREDYIKQHLGAKRFYSDNYRFEVKQSDLLFYSQHELGKVNGQISKDKKQVEALLKKIAKAEKVQKELQAIYDAIRSITEQDVNNSGDGS